MIALAVILTLTPHVAIDTHLRLVSEGTGEAPVEWYLDGEHVATTRDGQPISIPIDAGEHVLHAASDETGFWQVLARPDPTMPGQATYVPAWLAQNEPGAVTKEVPTWIGPALLGAVGLVGLFVPKNP